METEGEVGGQDNVTNGHAPATTGENVMPRKCGIVMPISDTEGYLPGHWKEVRNIFTDALNDSFEVNLVSESDEITIIHKTIVQNLYDNDLVICDVSSKNPNVMFELGIRLTFDRPTIIVIDDATDFTFDTGVIEHLKYPRDLRFQAIVDFKDKLQRKALATVQTAETDPNYSPFLKHFGRYHVSELPSQTLSLEDFISAKLAELSEQVGSLRGEMRASRFTTTRVQVPSSITRLDVAENVPDSILLETIRKVKNIYRDVEVVRRNSGGKRHVFFTPMTPDSEKNVELARMLLEILLQPRDEAVSIESE